MTIYLQSLVVLSRLPFINFFYEVSALISPEYFSSGESVLQNVCNEISNWPALVPGECVQLSLLGTVFQTYIPSLTSANMQHLQQQQQQTKRLNNDTDQIPIEPASECTIQTARPGATTMYLSEKEGETNANVVDNIATTNGDPTNNTPMTNAKCNNAANENDAKQYSDNDEKDTYNNLSQLSLTKKTVVLSSVYEIDIFRSLSSVLPFIHLLWELVLTAEPIVVMASSPADCSHMVQSLTR